MKYEEDIHMDFDPVEDYTRTKGSKFDEFNLDDMGEKELLALRAEVDKHLTVKKLADMDMETELVLQLRMAQALQISIIDDAHVPANQKAQVMNSVAGAIQQITKMQGEIYTSERLKRIESALIKQLNEWPEEQTRRFFDLYEEVLS